MSETLSQEEIDALRAALESGEAIEEGVQVAEPAPEQVRVVTYDFRKPHIVASDQHHALQMLHESAGKAIQAALLTQIKSVVEIKLVAVDQISYGEFVLSLSNPTYLLALATRPNIGNVAMQLDLSVVMTVTDILLGSDGQTDVEPRELTPLENGIFGNVTQSLLAELSAAWTSLTDLAFETVSQEFNPEYLQVATPETACLSMMFDVKVAETTGIMSICYPFNVIQAALNAAEERSGDRRGAGRTDGDAMLRALSVIPLNVHVVIGEGRMSAGRLVRLRPGDVVCLDRRADLPLDVYLGENRLFSGIPGKYKGKVAVRLQRPPGAAPRPAGQAQAA